MRRIVSALAALLALAAGCDGGNTMPMPLGDAGCGAMGVSPDQPAITCPMAIDLGCIPTGGATLTYATTAAACNGTPVTTSCDHPSGSMLSAPGTVTCTATSASGAHASCSFMATGRLPGVASLSCAPAVHAMCSAASTPVMVPAPTVNLPCEGGMVGTPTSNAPAAGFPVGTTHVTFTATAPSGAITCTTDVIVDDTSPPSITCPASGGTIARPATGAPIPGVSASDPCDPSVRIDYGAPLAAGPNHVTVTATNAAGLMASCSFDVTVMDVAPPTGLRIVSARLMTDATTDPTIGWNDDAGASVSMLAIERATDAAGPFTEIARVDPASLTYTDAAMPSPRAYYRLVAIDAMGAAGTPGAPLRVLSVHDDHYQLASQTVPTVTFPTTLYGVIRTPLDLASDGPFPLVVFLHGNHGNCRPAMGDDECFDVSEHDCTEPGYTTTPNAEGYVYLMETLAAGGYATVSLGANALNCRDDFIPERTQLILEHLRRWQRWSGSGDAPFGATYAGHVDIGHVVVVGHSRGGEAVSQVPQAIEASPIAGVSIASVFAIAPTDYHANRPVHAPYAVLLPSCDGDVSTLEGLRMYDRGMTSGDPQRRAQLLLIGANHNYFNTEWRFDDNLDPRGRACAASAQVGATAQRGMLEIALPDWVEATVHAGAAPTYVRAEAAAPAIMTHWAGRALELRDSFSSADRVLVDGFASTATDALGQPTTFTGYTAALTCTGTCAGNFPHQTTGARLAWMTAAASGRFGLGTLDAGTHTTLSMRFASRMATINNGFTEHDFTIRVTDGAGHTADLLVSSVGRVPVAFTGGDAAEVLSTVRVRLDRVVAVTPGFDVHSLASVELMMPVTGHDQGSIWVADVELAGD